MKRIAPVLIVIAAMVLGGCVFAPGGDNDWRRDHGQAKPTVGQQLIDLDRARDNGLISDAEFERAKRDILDSVK